MKNTTYQIQIALKYFKPKIWRRLLISSDTLLPDLHKIIQTAMGWENGHLHQFVKDTKFYSLKMQDDDFWDGDNNIDYKKLKIADLLSFEKDKMIYEYDFGDGWEHEIILEKIIPNDGKLLNPICIDGKMSCPPEDCGGVGGYMQLLEILSQPKHLDYEEYFEWYGGEIDPENFDKEDINEALREEDYGCFDMFL